MGSCFCEQKLDSQCHWWRIFRTRNYHSWASLWRERWQSDRPVRSLFNGSRKAKEKCFWIFWTSYVSVFVQRPRKVSFLSLSQAVILKALLANPHTFCLLLSKGILWPKNIIYNFKPLSALNNGQEEDSLFVYLTFCMWAFYCRCCTQHSGTLDTTSWAKHRILNQKGEIVV